MVRLKHLIATACLFLFICFATQGQSRQERFEAIENQKTAYITKQLNLTPKEAQGSSHCIINTEMKSEA